MFIRILPTTLLQIFCENLLYSQIITKSMKIADNISRGTPKCEWVNRSQSLIDTNHICITRLPFHITLYQPPRFTFCSFKEQTFIAKNLGSPLKLWKSHTIFSPLDVVWNNILLYYLLRPTAVVLAAHSLRPVLSCIYSSPPRAQPSPEKVQQKTFTGLDAKGEPMAPGQ